MLFEVEEAFLTSTRVECLPIATVDGRAVGRDEGASRPRTSRLRAELREMVSVETTYTTQSERRSTS